MDTTEKEIEMGAMHIATKIKPPKHVREKIYLKIAKEFWMAILIFAYFIFLNYGYANLENEVFRQDVKICTILITIAIIAVFEIAYRKDSGEIAIHGIELLFLGILTLFMPYVYIYRGMVFKFLYSFSSMYIAIYYAIKALIIYEIEIKKYLTNISDVKEIVEEKEISYLDEINKRKFADIRNSDEEIKQKEEGKRKFMSIIRKTHKEKISEEKVIEKEDENVGNTKKVARKKAPKKRKKKTVKSIMALNREKNKENGDKEND